MKIRKPSRWRVGDARITRIVDLEVSALEFLLPLATPQSLSAIKWLSPFVVPSGEAVAAIQSFVVESAGRTILVDSGAGAPARSAIPGHIERAAAYLEDLEAAGFAPDTIDTVVHTHLHFDHIGWNLRLRNGAWVPTFPNARYLVVAREWVRWSGPGADEQRAPVNTSIEPLLSAARVDFVEAGQEIAAGFRLEPTPGHTPGHVSMRIQSGRAQAVISGDVMHHPVQMEKPDWACTWDSDPDQARVTRARFLDDCASSRTLVFGTHFAHLPAGIVVRDGAAYRFDIRPPDA